MNSSFFILNFPNQSDFSLFFLPLRYTFHTPSFLAGASQYQYARAKMGMKHFEKPKGQERHQSHVGKKYASLTPQEQKSCMNQYDQKEYLYNRAFELIEKGKRDEGEELLENMKNASYIDLVYTTFENHQTFLMGVEISTSNYSYEDNSLHEQTAMELIQVQHYETIQI